jgi:hypothetical protein
LIWDAHKTLASSTLCKDDSRHLRVQGIHKYFHTGLP